MSPTLFDVDERGRAVIPEPRARRTDRSTSHAAAKSVRNQTATHERLIDVLERYGPATDEDISAYYGNLAELFGWPKVSPSGLRSRRAELVDLGVVVDTGEKGRTASGRACTVWELASMTPRT